MLLRATWPVDSHGRAPMSYAPSSVKATDVHFRRATWCDVEVTKCYEFISYPLQNYAALLDWTHCNILCCSQPALHRYNKS